MIQPRIWASIDLERDARIAKDNFRKSRLAEPLELYTKFFSYYRQIFEYLIKFTTEFSDDVGNLQHLIDILVNEETRMAFRYLAAPPISDDDLKTLAEAKFSSSALRQDPEQAKRVRDVIFKIIDPHRFPWFIERREPEDVERNAAILASAVLLATRKVETKRRMDAKKEQEKYVKDILRRHGIKELPSRDIRLLKDAPEAGEFCGESRLGDTRADFVIGLYDNRVMPLECKVSNSEVNSFKRVNHEAAGKARAWLHAFGRSATVPAAVLRGVFNPKNLEAAQREASPYFGAIVWPIS